MKKIGANVYKIIVVIILFIVLSYGFVPQVLSNKVVYQEDIKGYRGMSYEANQWDNQHPENPTAWTNSMFGGMPTIMITGNHKGDLTEPIFKALLTGKRPASYLFLSLLGGLLLMLSLGVNILPATIGAIAITFCSYNLQIIQVGHNTKMLAIAFLPYVLAACIYTYRKGLNSPKWLLNTILGSSLFGLAVSMQIKANHVQITYYLAIIMLFYVLCLFIYIIAKKERWSKLIRFFCISILLFIFGMIGIGTNANQLIPTYKYSHETMRGGSELKSDDGKKHEGLDLNYATAWSYGVNEIPNLLIPNYNGGSSMGSLSMKSETIQTLRKAGQPNLTEISKHLPLYWGPQPFTAGPMYMGAITIFLFILGLLLYQKKEKWWILATTIFAILLAFGSHFMIFTELMFKYAPMYNKFRTVSMALIILQFTLPILGVLVLDRILKNKYEIKTFKKKSIIALAITAGFCLLVYIIPSIAGNFTSSNDSRLPDFLISSLRADRISLLKTDAMTSLIAIVITFALLWWSYRPNKNDGNIKSMTIAILGIGIVMTINMFSIGHRYLNSEHFVTQTSFDAIPPQSIADKSILTDNNLDYRVLNLSSNTFNESQTSFYHKSIGGYSPVKLQRYQDLIDNNIINEMNTLISQFQKGISIEEQNPDTKVLNMLNTKYIIISPDAPALLNKYAYGNAWFVDSLTFVSNPKQEIGSLENNNLKKIAIIRNNSDAKCLPNNYQLDSTNYIKLVSYSPNKLVYEYKINSDQFAVFSEIYYKDGWIARTENGKKVDIFRTDWILRGCKLSKDENKLIFSFEPESYKVGSNISLCSSILLIILIILSYSLKISKDFKTTKS